MMAADFPFTFSGDKFCLDDVNAAFEYIWKQVCDLKENPPTPIPEGAVLADGSVPIDGCLRVLNGGCLEDEHLARWGDIREWFTKRMCGVAVEKLTDADGCFVVDFTGADFSNPPIVGVLQGAVSTITPAVAEGNAVFVAKSITPTQATICVYDQAGVKLAAQNIRAYVTAVAK